MSNLRVRFTVRRVMLALVIVAVTLAALLNASDLWASLWFTATAGMLLIAIVGVAYRRGERRAFWLGFALFGWGHLLVGFGPWYSYPIEPPALLGTVLVDYSYFLADPFLRGQLFKPNRIWPIGLYNPNPPAPPMGVPPSQIGRIDVEAYQQVGHSIAALTTALIGGIVVRRFAGQDDRQSSPP